ncbi:MAG TPA: hypothetical protein VJI74_03555 [Candidatus Paceibacterota bacterium]
MNSIPLHIVARRILADRAKQTAKRKATGGGTGRYLRYGPIFDRTECGKGVNGSQTQFVR